MTLLQHHVLALAFTSITTFALGLLVFSSRPNRRLNQVFGLYSLAISGWSFTEAFVVGSNSAAIATFWSRLCWQVVIFIAPTFLHSVVLLTDPENRKMGRFIRYAYLVSFLYLCLHTFTNSLTLPPRPVGYTHFHNSLGRLGFVIPLTFLVLVHVALWKLWQAYRVSSGQRRTQFKYLFWSSLAGYFGGSPDWFFTFGFHVPYLNPLGIYAVPCYSVATTYAILRHNLFDVHLLIRRSLVYSILITFLTVGYFSLVHGIERIFQMTLGYHSLWISLGGFAFMALLFQPLKIGIQRLVDWLVFRAPHEELVRRMERLEEQARQAEKFKAISTLAAGMAHEIKNPLTALQTFAEFLPERRSDPAFLDKLQEVLSCETHRMRGIIQELLDFARPKPPQLKPVDLEGILSSTVNLLSSELLKYRVEWTIDCQHNGAILYADPDQLRQVLINLIQNAADAMSDGGTLTLATRANNGHLELVVSDTGQGIPRELLPKIFDPFVTAKPNGNGLGLSIVHSIIRAHHGSIRADSQPGKGTTFTLRFPL